ncbi:hypothetical protein HIM_01024 [Hirsutella minnesotensis 3608]|nr:hypothetical protein HIM_01024 [Hirsutella minnesotensis 3608]
MDGLSNESLWMPVLVAADFADRLLSADIVTVLFSVIVLLFYLYLGSLQDLVLAAAFFLLKSASRSDSRIRSTALTLTVASCGLFLTRWAALSLFRSWSVRQHRFNWDGPGKPLLIPCRTTHRRQFPKTHAFSYSYLVVGVPVGLHGNASNMISVDLQSRLKADKSPTPARKGWFDVDAGDYLQRGHGHLGLRGKLDAYLESQDVAPSDYPHAYLVTAARFLGHHFNPVSFWFLYSSDKVLSAIVLEVNNTFGERRPYLVLRDFAGEARLVSAADSASSAAPSRVKGAWPKDFHVSPFNSRKGSYSVLANDPLGPNMEGFRGVDITINLKSSKGHPKLVARLFSEGQALDSSVMSAAQKTRFLLSWFWVGYVTFPRIVKEAAVLFFKRNLHVWYRPEPLKDSLGRLADDIEKDLEDVFRRYLQHLVLQSPKSLSVRYVASGIPDLTAEIYKSRAGQGQDAPEQVEIKILTPIFYSRLVHYAHDFEAIFSELTENGTLWVDKPHMLPDIFLRKAPTTLHTSNVTDFACFKLIQKLRRRPAPISQEPVTSAGSADETTRAVDVRGFRMSPLDAFVLAQMDKQLKARYRAAVLRLFTADHLLMGYTELLGAIEFVGRAALALVCVSIFTSKMR